MDQVQFFRDPQAPQSQSQQQQATQPTHSHSSSQSTSTAQWLQQPSSHTPYASPTATSPSLSDTSYAGIFQQQQQQQRTGNGMNHNHANASNADTASAPGSSAGPNPNGISSSSGPLAAGQAQSQGGGNNTPLPRTSSSLSLNMSSLTVSVNSPSGSQLSPLPPSTAGSLASPVTPGGGFGQVHARSYGGHGLHSHGHSLAPQHQQPQAVFRFTAPDTSPSPIPLPVQIPMVYDPSSSGPSSSTSSNQNQNPGSSSANHNATSSASSNPNTSTNQNSNNNPNNTLYPRPPPSRSNSSANTGPNQNSSTGGYASPERSVPRKRPSTAISLTVNVENVHGGGGLSPGAVGGGGGLSPGLSPGGLSPGGMSVSTGGVSPILGGTGGVSPMSSGGVSPYHPQGHGMELHPGHSHSLPHSHLLSHPHHHGGGMYEDTEMYPPPPPSSHSHHPHHPHAHHSNDKLNSPMDMEDSPSSTSFPDDLGLGGGAGGGYPPSSLGGGGLGSAGGIGIGGKPGGSTNNFVSKLYAMISDSKSTKFISWTGHGTSFVVSHVGEFSRSILGTHFKHNNFSSFVRQLNMYGFSKINRTPRAQRASADSQTWEFAHAKFLRGRPDLLDEIRRKALEPDPAIKQRVELPGELAAQLNHIREENKRVVRALEDERERNRRLASVLKVLYDVVAKGFGHEMPPFPSDLTDHEVDNPPIFITSPVSNSPTHYSSMDSLYPLHSLSPTSSPTAADFPHHPNQTQLSHPHQQQQQRGLSLPHITTIPFDQTHGPQGMSSLGIHINTHTLPQSHTRLSSMSGSMTPGRYGEGPSSPSPLNTPISGPEDDVMHMRVKRQRTTPPGLHDHMGVGPGSSGIGPVGGGGPGANVTRRLARARSDSAPLGQGQVGLNAPPWGQARPRSGSGLGLGSHLGYPPPGSGGGLPQLSMSGLMKEESRPPDHGS